MLAFEPLATFIFLGFSKLKSQEAEILDNKSPELKFQPSKVLEMCLNI